MKTVIMAGGKGTRMSNFIHNIPKPMITVCGKPILEHQITVLKNQDINEIIIVVGYLGNQIKKYFGDGATFGVKIQYITEESPLGTAGALWYLKKSTEDILLIHGDLLFDIDIHKFYETHKAFNSIITLVTHPNSHPYDSTLLVVDKKNCICNWIKKEERRGDYKNRVNAGIHLLSPKALNILGEHPIPLDLDRDIIQKFVKEQSVYAYDTPEYIKDMGTPERYYEVCSQVKQGIPALKNLRYQQKAIFLDRDGTINKSKGFITSSESIELLPEAAAAIKLINLSEYLAIIITNQSVIARGECTVEELEKIHNHLETILGEEGAYVDKILYCPHHPNKGFKGENPKYKIDCNCRKPHPGMLLEAAKEYHINLSKSFMVGDSLQDKQAGENAGCRGIQLKNGLTVSIVEKILKGTFTYESNMG